MKLKEVPKYKSIPGIEKIVKEKLKTLKIRPCLKLKGFIQKNKRFYSTPCLSSDGKKVFFKMLIVADIGAADDLKREIKITKFLSNLPELKGKLNIALPIDVNIKKFPYWALVQHIKGPLMGRFYKIYKLGQKEKYISSLNDNLISLQEISQKLAKEISQKSNLWKRSYRGYLQMVRSYERSVGQERGKINFRQIYNLFKSRKKIFRGLGLVVAHGDFTLANFLTHKPPDGGKEKVYLTDWEHCHLDNFAYDIAHLWIQLWRYPAWRKKLILDFISRLPKNKIAKFKELFRLIIITEALGELRWSLELCEKKYQKGVINHSHKTIKNFLKSSRALLIM